MQFLPFMKHSFSVKKHNIPKTRGKMLDNSLNQNETFPLTSKSTSDRAVPEKLVVQ